jgi:hypothetical protein
MATADHRSAAQGNPLAGLIRSGRFEVSVVRKVRKRETAAPQFEGSRPNGRFAGKVSNKWKAFIDEHKANGNSTSKALRNQHKS